LSFDLLLGWMNGEHHCVELIESFPFDYSYALGSDVAVLFVARFKEKKT
jgi:hypothetical protein